MSLSVILNQWRRPYLEMQLQHIYAQTTFGREFDEHNVYVYQNESHVDIEPLRARYKFQHVHCKDNNFKYFGRFTLPLILDTEYVTVIDDDTMPGPRWFQNCLEHMVGENCVLIPEGRIITKLQPFEDIGVMCQDARAEKQRVDFGMKGWFFRRDLIKTFWQYTPHMLDTGEDIHLCAVARLYAGLKTYIPKCPTIDDCGDLYYQLGTDDMASYKIYASHDSNRSKIVAHWLKGGWDMQNRSTLIKEIS